jgi:hypothetical protein
MKRNQNENKTRASDTHSSPKRRLYLETLENHRRERV